MRLLPTFVDNPQDHTFMLDYSDEMEEILNERVRAHNKHDSHGHSMERAEFNDPRWLPVLVEEVGEVAKEICEAPHAVSSIGALRHQHKMRLREELIQVMAMCSAWIDAIEMDRP